MHGKIHLPSRSRTRPTRSSSCRSHAASRARASSVPPIVTYEGLPKDGNRRIAASLLVLDRNEYTRRKRSVARWIRVWRAPEGTTEDQFDAIVVALNFEDDHKSRGPSTSRPARRKPLRTARRQVKGRFTRR